MFFINAGVLAIKIFSFLIIVFLCTPLVEKSFGSSVLEIDEIHRGKRQKSSPSASVIITAYFSKKLEETEGKVHKVKIHKLIYYANGLHYALTDTPLVAESFEAHQYGNFLPLSQNLLDESLDRFSRCSSSLNQLLKSADTIAELETIRPELDTTIEIFGKYKSGELSDFTHEPSTPWSKIRPRWSEPLRNGCTWHDMNIPQELDKEYFSEPANITRFFIVPYVEGKVKKKKNTVKVLSTLLKKEPSLFPSFISSKLESIKEIIEVGDSIEDAISEFLENFKGVELYNDVFRQSLGNIFAHTQQSIAEGALSEVLFNSDFIEQNEIELFFDESFRVRTAFAAKLNNLSALYYLQRILETFSDEENDAADRYAKEASIKLSTAIERIISVELPPEPSWQILYEKALAYFYHSSESEKAVPFIVQALEIDPPTRYQKDLLKRAFFLTGNQEYVDQGIRCGFKEFSLYQAANVPSLEEAFPLFEQGICEEIPGAFFEAGKSILREGYVVTENSLLWEKFGLSQPSAEDMEESNTKNITLGDELLKQAIRLNVQEALSFFIDWCGDDLEKALTACELVKEKPWSLYQRAKIKEKQYKLEEAIFAYRSSGPLLGYLDAARLETQEREEAILEEYKEEKNRILEKLAEILE